MVAVAAVTHFLRSRNAMSANMLDSGNRATTGKERRRSNEVGIESIGNPDDRPEVSGGSGKKFLYTLPPKFKRLRGKPIGIANENPSELIESLGDVLKIEDYKTNMASFWFLDTLALQVHKHTKNLDDYYLSVLISWLTGEMSLIRDKKLSREEFLRLMKEMFRLAANVIAEEHRCPYWDWIEVAEGMEENDMENATTHLVEDGDSSLKDLEGNSTKTNQQSNLDKKESLSNDEEDETDAVFSNMDPLSVLDIIMESTYNMYANELRYFLVYSVFVESIEVQSYQLPFTLRTPRPVKLAGPKSLRFSMELHKKLEKLAMTDKKQEKVTTDKGKKTDLFAIPHAPAVSLIGEEILVEKRKFILPLIEANETLKIFDMLGRDD